ncbi:hypothetical protein ACT4U6_11790 [Acinetobacter baumannii]
MDNYKIKVKDEAESKEAQELFFDLGYRWNHNGQKYFKVSSGEILAYSRGALFQCGDDTGKELTLPQLRDLVVLKRNDVKDANKTNSDNGLYFLSSDNVIYRWEEKWVRSILNDSEDYNLVIKHGLTPISKPKTPYLVSCNVKNTIGSINLSDPEDYAIWVMSGKTGITKPQDPALFSIDDVWKAFWKNQKVQYSFDDDNHWQDDIESLKIEDIKSGHYQFRLKPQTIKLELEIPAPYKAKIGGRDDASFVLNVGRHQYCYKTEEDYTKARDALEAVFDAAVRGTNS